MKRLPIVLTLVALIALAASVAYWILQLYQPPQRPLTAAPVAAVPEPSMDAAATLFGGQAAAQVATNYTLTGVISAGPQSVAIISANGAPAKALVLGKELAPGVTINEVHARYVMLSDGGVMKRIDLAPDSKAAAPMGGPGGGAQAAMPSQPVSVPEPQMDAGAEAAHPDVGVHDQPPPPSPTNPPLNMGPVQPVQPVQQAQQAAPVQPQPQVQQLQQPQQPQQPVTMPAPIRSPNNPVVQPPTSR